MARTSDTADYMVTQCQACGMLNMDRELGILAEEGGFL